MKILGGGMFAAVCSDARGQSIENPLPSATDDPLAPPETERFETIERSQIVWVDGVSDGSLSTFDED